MKSNKINLNLFTKKRNYHVQFAASAFCQRLLCFNMLQIIMACKKKIQTWVEYPCNAKLRSEMNRTKESPKILLMESSGNNFISLSLFNLIMWVMKSSKNFGKIAILKIWELIFLGVVKTHFGKLALKWCIFRHEIKIL